MMEEKERTDAFKTGFYQDYSQRNYTQASFNYPYGGYNNGGASNPNGVIQATLLPMARLGVMYF